MAVHFGVGYQNYVLVHLFETFVPSLICKLAHLCTKCSVSGLIDGLLDSF